MKEPHLEGNKHKLEWNCRHLRLRCKNHHPCIGRPIDFELEVDDPQKLNEIESIKLFERLICSEALSVTNLDPHSLHDLNPGINTPTLRIGELPSSLSPEELAHCDHPAWFIDHAAHVETFAPTYVNHHAINARLFSFLIPPKVKYQSTFSNHAVYNFWMVRSFISLSSHALFDFSKTDYLRVFQLRSL